MKQNEIAIILNKYIKTYQLLNLENVTLQRRLCNPSISYERAMSEFYKANKVCEKLLTQYDLITDILLKFNIEDRRLLYLYIIKNKTCYEVSEIMKISRRTFFRRYMYISNRFMILYKKEGNKNG